MIRVRNCVILIFRTGFVQLGCGTGLVHISDVTHFFTIS